MRNAGSQAVRRRRPSQANTGLPAAKIGFESVVGAVAGSAMCYAVVYAAYGANGGSHDPSPTKAAVSLALGAACLAAVTAARFRWPQHVLLAGLLCNLTLAVGVAVTYYATARWVGGRGRECGSAYVAAWLGGGRARAPSACPPPSCLRLWRFLLYWLWFVGLSQLFMVAVATFVLPLPAGGCLGRPPAVVVAAACCLTLRAPEPSAAVARTACARLPRAGWVVRKQLSRALRQEGAVLEAVVRLMTELEPDGGSGGSTKTSAPLGEAASEAGLQQQQQQQQHTQWVGDEGDDFSPPRSEDEQPQGGEDDSPLVRAHRWLCRRWRAARLRRVPSLVRMQASLCSISLSGRRGAVDDHHAARALGIRPDLYLACEPIYRMSGPTAASLQVGALRSDRWRRASLKAAAVSAGGVGPPALHRVGAGFLPPHARLPQPALPPPAAAGAHRAVVRDDDDLPAADGGCAPGGLQASEARVPVACEALAVAAAGAVAGR